MEIYNNILKFDTLDSTNAHAFKIIEQEKVEEFTTIFTQNQTKGKGQRGNTWLSEPSKNCLFSVILYPTCIPANNQFILSQAVSVALQQTIKKYCNNVYIKWPNDIYVNNKKIGGILIENVILGTHISKTVVGIGLNCNQTTFEQSLPNPTSLAIETGAEFDCMHILHECIHAIKQTYEAIPHERIIIEQTYHNALYQKDIQALYKDCNEIFEAQIIGVEPTGKLIVKDTHNQIHTYNFKEIEFLKNNS